MRNTCVLYDNKVVVKFTASRKLEEGMKLRIISRRRGLQHLCVISSSRTASVFGWAHLCLQAQWRWSLQCFTVVGSASCCVSVAVFVSFPTARGLACKTVLISPNFHSYLACNQIQLSQWRWNFYKKKTQTIKISPGENFHSVVNGFLCSVSVTGLAHWKQQSEHSSGVECKALTSSLVLKSLFQAIIWYSKKKCLQWVQVHTSFILHQPLAVKSNTNTNF